jgi:hypothetical protein
MTCGAGNIIDGVKHTASRVAEDLVEKASRDLSGASRHGVDASYDAGHPYHLTLHTDTHVFPGLAQYASVGVHFNVPLVLASTALVALGGVLLFSQLWENVWRQKIFGEELDDAATRTRVLCGVDVSAYAIFDDAKVVRAGAFAEWWHHGQLRNSGEPYVVHCVEAARITAALLPPDVNGKKKYVDAVVACILHDVVDDTECAIEDVEAEFGSTVAKLVTDVSKLGNVSQILRRKQRRTKTAAGWTPRSS